MKRMALLLIAFAAGSVIMGLASPAAGHVDDEAAPIFGIKIPPGYRDWPVVSVAHEEGTLNDLRAVLGNEGSDQGLSGRKASVPGRHNHYAAGLDLRPLRGKQQGLWAPAIIRCRAAHERSVHGERLKKICCHGRLGVRPI